MVSNLVSNNKQEILKNYKNLNEIKKKSGTMLLESYVPTDI